MKLILKDEYKAARIRFYGSDHLVGHINPLLYEKMYNEGFKYMFNIENELLIIKNNNGIKKDDNNK